MTTLEFVAKNLHKAKINLKKAKERPNVSPDEIAMLEEQIKHYEEIGKLLPADVVEVVRCKGCVYANDDGTICRYSVGRYTKPNNYCSDGERKDEDDG
jgi:hypothetical protein